MNKMNIKEKNASIVITILGTLALFIISLYRIGQKDGLWYADEFGYVSSAAFFAGVDWSEQVSHLGYYGIGYGLMLFPLFYICTSLKTLMLCINLVNCLLLCSSYLLCVYILKLLFPQKDKNVISLISLGSLLYVGNVVHVNMAWSEIPTIFIYWLITFFLLRFSYTNKHIYAYLMIIASCFAVFVHMRNITIAMSALVVIIYQIRIKKNMNIKQVLIMFFLLSLGIVLFFYSKNYIQTTLYLANGTKQGNDFGVVTEMALNVSSNDGKYLFDSLICKLFYLASSSFFLVPIGIIFMLTYILKYKCDRKYIMFLFALCSFFGAFFITVYFMKNGIRKDNYFYARYYEPSIGLVLPVGIIEGYEKLKEKKITHCIGAFIVYEILFKYSNGLYNALCLNPKYKDFITLCVPGMTRYILNNDFSEILEKQFFTTISILAIIITIIFIGNKFTFERFSLLISIIIISLFWINSSMIEINHTVEETNKRYQQVKELTDYIDGQWNCDNRDVSYLAIGSWNEYLLSIQAELGSTPIHELYSLDELMTSPSKYLLTRNRIDSDIKKQILFMGYQIKASNNNFSLYEMSEKY